jgi:hypothetical protein
MTTLSNTSYTNALIDQTSPYLLQHAHNPVQWYPWGETALTLAKQLNKPILLSIGYSACHWCHVMAHESFADPRIAEVMNELFINIKVDREERPDLDKIYQLAHQILTQRAGGWPLTMFLTPDTHYPFFGGTYFPPNPRYGLPAFSDILKQVATFYHHHPDQITEQNHSLANTLESYFVPPTTMTAWPINIDLLNSARDEIAQLFEARQGGFSKSPKFPQLPILEYLLHYYATTTRQGTPDKDSLEMVWHTLKKMALGGIYDQLGGGFFRYSVDDTWTIPHFEKMLYDNGAFLTIYSEAWQLLQVNPQLSPSEHLDELFQRTVLETAAWVCRELQSPEGGFYSSLDADSEGEEGKFYCWTKDKLKNLLKEELYPLTAYHFGFTRPANFEGHHWHLHVHHEREEVAKKYNLSLPEVHGQLDKAREILFQTREQRVRPGRDEKILTAWNALMIKGMATVGHTFARPDYLDTAFQALDFIKKTLWVQGRLRATYKDGKAHLNAYLDDYVLLLEAILTLLQARWRDGDLSLAIALAEVLLTEFQDIEHGGFYFTANHHETLITRPKLFADDALPAGNGIAALVLIRLGHLLGETRYLAAAERTLQVAWPNMTKLATIHPTMLSAVAEYLYPPQIIILRGEPDDLTHWQTQCQKDYVPHRLCFAIPTTATDLPSILSQRQPQETTVAYVCQGTQCSAPITSLEELMRTLAE